ncbi:MAG: hypothetical protein WA857_10165 [Candidatus Acidiferrum sp.]
MEEAATPFPKEETTPPVTKIYFGAIHAARFRDFPERRAYPPSSGLTYKQLWAEKERVSNRRNDFGNSKIRGRELESKGSSVRAAEAEKYIVPRNFSAVSGLNAPGRSMRVWLPHPCYRVAVA